VGALDGGHPPLPCSLYYLGCPTVGYAGIIRINFKSVRLQISDQFAVEEERAAHHAVQGLMHFYVQYWLSFTGCSNVFSVQGWLDLDH
jgi:hypothetical protein